MVFFSLWLHGKKKEIKTCMSAWKSSQSKERVQKREENNRGVWLNFFFRWENVLNLFVAVVVWMKEEKNHTHLFHSLMHSVRSFVNASQLVTSNLTSIPFLWVEEERGWGDLPVSCLLYSFPLTIIGKTNPKVAQRAANLFTVCDRK